MPINGHDPAQPDLRTPEQRLAWGRQHGLPDHFLLVAHAEMAQIQTTVQAALSENLKWRAAARLTFNDKTPQDLVKSIQRLQHAYAEQAVAMAKLQRGA